MFVLSGGRVYGKYEICHTTLIDFYYRFLVIVYLFFMRYAEDPRYSMKSCVSHSLVLTRSIAMYSFTFPRYNSVCGHNLLVVHSVIIVSLKVRLTPQCGEWVNSEVEDRLLRLCHQG